MTLAHVGHWLLDLLYVLPVLVVVAWISIRALLDKRAAAATDAESGAPAPPPAGDPPG